MTRALLIVLVVGSLISIAAYIGARSVNPDLLDAMECVVDGCAAVTADPAASASLKTSALAREIDRYFEPLVATNNFYGTVYVQRGDEVLADSGYGWA